MPLPIALQMYTVRDTVADQGPAKVFDALRTIGYQAVELAGDYGLSAAELKAMLDDNGLSVVASHVAYNAIRDNLSKVIDDTHTLGHTHVVCPWLDASLQTPDGYLGVARMLGDAESHPDAQGLTFCYHNHDFEFRTLDDGRRGIDIMFSQPGPSSELDLYWVAKGGDDPAVWMDRLKGRLPLLHMKDMDASGGFAPVGTGTLDLQKLTDLAPSVGAQALIVEQDSGWPEDDPMLSARIGFEHLAQWVG
ncbi:MAG: sugar phosphate isomerase/epimerase [Planctomycetota bacterium]